MKTSFFISILLSTSLFAGCFNSATIPHEHRPENWGQVLKKEQNFYQISSFVYRSEQPNDELIPELKKYKIDTVVNLRSRNPDPQVFAQEKFSLLHVPIHTWAIDRNDLLEVMRHIQTAQRANQKILIHCYHGSDRTGASIAMYRIIFENWSTEDALKEMKHGGYGFHPIWINIEKNFTPENIKWIREQLTNPS